MMVLGSITIRGQPAGTTITKRVNWRCHDSVELSASSAVWASPTFVDGLSSARPSMSDKQAAMALADKMPSFAPPSSAGFV